MNPASRSTDASAGISRRQFFGAAAFGSAALMAAPATLSAATRRNIPIGVQLYSVRNVFNPDVPGTLAGIKKLGYEGVEFAGYSSFANDAKGLRKLLDDTGLKVCGSHLPGALGDVSAEKIDHTIEFNEILGNNKLIVAQLRINSQDDWEKQADVFSGVAEKLKPHKMRIGYHNHTQEFKPTADGKVPEYLFFDRASPDVFVQLDIGHCKHSGADPAAVLKRFGSRVLSVHAKDYGASPENDVVGEGTVAWPEVLDATDADTGLQWYIVEEESGKFQGLDGIAKSFANLKKLLAG